MSINKVIFGDETLIDLTSDTVKPSLLMSGVTAHDCTGTSITGTIIARTSSDIEVAGPTVLVPSGAYSVAVSTTIPEAVLNTKFDLSLNNLNYSLNNSTGLLIVSGAISKQDSSVKYSSTAGYAPYVANNLRITTTVASNYQLSTQAAATITPTESVQTAAQSGKFLTGNITVGAISSDYIGSNIPQRTSSNLSASGSYIIVPSGYYAAQASKPVSGGSAKTPATTITAQPAISISASGLITATNSKTQNVTPTVTAGYVSSGTAGTITVNGSNTSQLTTKAAETYTPGTSDQTISANQYLTGAQTVKGDANLIAANIASGVTIFGITGTHQGGITPTGTISISSNGTYDVTNYAAASVNIGATVVEKRLIVPEGMIGV